MGRQIHYADFLEEMIGETLQDVEIEFIHESELPKTPILDFYLTDEDVYIEVKQFYSERSVRQMESKKDAILIQGRKAVAFFNELLKQKLATKNQ